MNTALVVGGTITYGYDSEGRRINQKQGSTLTNYIWDEGSAYGDVLLETNGTGALGTSYAIADGMVLAQTKSGGTSYLLHDTQGSTRALSGTNGSIGESHVYDAYGALRDVSSTPGTKYLYTGQQFDAPTNLYSLRARYYNTALGQFLNRDTVNDGLNLYGYVHGNPINRYDPSGHQAAYESAQTTRALAVLTTAYVIGVGIAAYLVVDSIERTLSRAHVDAPTLPDLDNPPNEGKKPKQEPDDRTSPPRLPRSGSGCEVPLVPPSTISLSDEEANGGHTIEFHVIPDKIRNNPIAIDDWLKTRLPDPNQAEKSSSAFYDLQTGDRAVAKTIQAKWVSIRNQLMVSGKGEDSLRTNDNVGRWISNNPTDRIFGSKDVPGTRVVCLCDPSRSQGFRVLTSYPSDTANW